MEKSLKLEHHTPETLFPAPKSRKAVPELPLETGTALEQPGVRISNIPNRPDVWISDFPELWDLCWTLYCAALIYDLAWAQPWSSRWYDWSWVKVAMAQTYRRLNPEDHVIVQEAYEAFVQNTEHYDNIAFNHSAV